MVADCNWFRVIVVFLVVLSTVSPRLFSKSAVGNFAATEFKWDGSEKEGVERELESSSFEGWGESEAPRVAVCARSAEGICCDCNLLNPWATRKRELPARAPPITF